jgi:hypothetical protein
VGNEMTKKKSIGINQLTLLIYTEFLNSEGNFYMHNTDVGEIEQIIEKLKIKSASGFDDIQAKLFKNCQNELVLPFRV